jgi:uncharacterized SAM-binding protein YcdF (DUF218 family)
MRRVANIAIIIALLMVVTLLLSAAQAKVDWEVSNAIQLEATPVDVAITQEGGLTFLLTDQAQVLIYAADGKLVGTVPVDPAVTEIAVSVKGEQLYLINSKRKTLQTVTINFIVDINVADSPFLGPAGAEVVLVVFSDFQ